MNIRIFITLGVLTMSSFSSLVAQAQSIHLVREKRIQSFQRSNLSPNDVFDSAVYSPKSAAFSQDGRKLYVNSLEGFQTVVYSWPEARKLKVINHSFNGQNQNLFQNNESTVFDYPFFSGPENKNIFKGKPVEMTFSHGGRYLWVPYYRRDYDESAQSPSALAIIDTRVDQIVRVMPTGPIPKFVTASPDGQTMAVTYWGDNTVGLIDISSGDVRDFSYKEHLVVEKQLSQQGLEGTDRDVTCGFCLRGTVFTPDSRYLILARMGGGGLAAFDLQKHSYMGTVLNVKATPRHLLLSEDGRELIVSSNQSGYITVFNLEVLLKDLSKAQGRRVMGSRGRELFVGLGARTIELDSRHNILYAAVNDGLKLVAIDMTTFKVLTDVAIDPYPVGLAVSPDGDHVVVTSQGHAGFGGGNAVNIVRVERD